MSSAYNIIGDIMSEGSGATLPGRVAIEDAEDAIAFSAIKNPYTGLNFGWDCLEKLEQGTHQLPY